MARTPFRFATLVLPLLLSMSLGSALAVAGEPDAAIPVSPGDSQAGALIGDPCPSFSWGAVTGAQRYELAIFDAQWDDSPGYAEQARQGIALRRIEIDAPALSWTPAGSECLDEGGSYLWFVRAATAEGEEPWSAPRYFAIDYDADALTQTVRRELVAQLRQPAVWREVIQAALSGNRALELTPLASAALMPTATTDTATRAGGNEATSGWETSAISPQATTFPNPSALKVNSPYGVVFNRSATGGGIPAQGDGTRFMWYPGKGALRAGYASGTQWDDANVGYFSTAMGSSTTASGLNSTAVGIGTTASGDGSTAMGYFAQAIAHYSTAMGYYTTASSSGSTATGYSSQASGPGSTAMGNIAVASGSHSTAMGNSTLASGNDSTALGDNTTAASAYETVIGRYNTNTEPISSTDWESRDRLFVIGNGTGDTARSDALVVFKSGDLFLFGQAYKPDGGMWLNSSDIRLKHIRGEYNSGLEEIAALQPVRYQYAVGNARGHDPEPEYVGFIAQQAQAVFPEAVSEGADGYLDFNMHAVNVAMVNAIHTLREQNQIQQELIVDLHAQNAELKQHLVRLEAEQRRSAKLYAEIASRQAQMQVLQGQMAGATDHGQVVLGR